MDGLELNVRQPCSNEEGHTVIRIVEAFECGHAIGHGGVGRWHEFGVAGPRAANPVLGAAEFARRLAASPPAR